MKNINGNKYAEQPRFSAPAKDDAFLRRLLLSRNTVKDNHFALILQIDCP